MLSRQLARQATATVGGVETLPFKRVLSQLPIIEIFQAEIFQA